MADSAAGAARVATKLCVEIYQAYQTVKILPDLAKSLSDRVQLFKPRLNQLMKGDFCPQLDPLPHINALNKVLNEIKAYLKKLEDDSILSKAKSFVFYRGVLSDYEKLNARLDQCRGDLQFDFEFDSLAERDAFENETKGLACGLVEQNQEISDEQRLQREMLQGQRKMLSEILKYIRSNKKLNLTTQNSPTIETAMAIVDSANQAEVEQIITEQVSKEYEIPSLDIELLDIMIGKGTFGLIYKARYNNEDVAIKKPHLSDTDVLEELLNQSRCDGSVFVASVHGFTRINNTLSIVMEFAPCGSLASLLQSASGGKGIVSAKDPNLSNPFRAKISVEAVTELLHQIALGIEYIHQRRVIHRDIKPDNILLAHDLTPMLTDFGSARELTDSATHVTGSAAGSLYFMAPEVIKIANSGSGQYSYSVDIYGFGATIVTMCNRLYGGAKQSRRHAPPKDSALPSEFPPSLTEIKDKCLSEVPRNRYGRGTSSGELVSRALEGVSTNGNVAPRPSYDGVHGVELPVVAKVARIAAQKQVKAGTSSGITASTASSSRPSSSGGVPNSVQTAVAPSPTSSGASNIAPVTADSDDDPETGSSTSAVTRDCKMSPKKRKLLVIGGIAIMVVAIIIGIVVAVTGGWSSEPTPSPGCDNANSFSCRLSQESYDIASLELTNRGLTGTIPTGIGLFTNLNKLYLYENALTGTIPTEIGLMTSLSWFVLNNNKLTGTIPSEIAQLTDLTQLRLEDNKLTGTIPSEIALMTWLRGLYLYSNKLTGTIPSEISLLTRLGSLGLDDNGLTGTIPSEIARLTSLEFLSLVLNAFSGNFTCPDTIDYCYISCNDGSTNRNSSCRSL